VAFGRRKQWKRKPSDGPLCPSLQASRCTAANWRLGPTTDICSAAERLIFENLAGSENQAVRNCQIQRFCGLEIGHNCELGRLRHRQVGSSRPEKITARRAVSAGLPRLSFC